MVFLDLLEDWLAELKRLNRSKKTLRNYRQTMSYYFKSVESLNHESYKTFIDMLVEQDRSPHTINSYIRSLRAFVKWLEAKELIEPWSSKIKNQKTHRKAYPMVTDEIAEQIIEAGTKIGKGDNSRNRAIKLDCRYALKLVLRTGMRISEVRSLRSDQVYLDEKPARMVITSKGGNQDALPIPLDMVEPIRERLHKKLVFKFSENYANQVIRRGRKRLGVKQRITCHSLRRIFATYMIKQGVSDFVVQKILRHTDINLTRNLYSIYVVDDLAPAVNMGQRLVRKSLSVDTAQSAIFDMVEKFVGKDDRFMVVEDDEGIHIQKRVAT